MSFLSSLYLVKLHHVSRLVHVNVVHFICALFLQYQQLDLVNRVQFAEVLIFYYRSVLDRNRGLKFYCFLPFFRSCFGLAGGLAVAATPVH